MEVDLVARHTTKGRGMKKTISLTLILLLAICSASFAESAKPDTTVYLSSSFNDSRYHLKFCPRVNGLHSKTKVTLQYAIDKKHPPCDKCKPPTKLAYRIAPPKPKKKQVTKSRVLVGHSAADIERDPDGTAVGSGGGFTNTTSNKPASNRYNTKGNKEEIIDRCEAKWGTDYNMVKYCVDNQTESSSQLNRMSVSKEIQSRCEDKWGTDYNMVKYCVDNQTESKNQLRRMSISPEIRSRCEAKWGTDYDMVKYCVDK